MMGKGEKMGPVGREGVQRIDIVTTAPLITLLHK